MSAGEKTDHEGDDQYESLRHAHLEALAERIILTFQLKKNRETSADDDAKPTVYAGDLDALKKFVRDGGNIDRYEFREIIAGLIGAERPKNPGGSKDVRDIIFYMDVEAHILAEVWRNPGKKRNLNAALRHVGKDSIGSGKVDDPAMKQLDKIYRKGKKLVHANQWTVPGAGTKSSEN